MIKNTFSHIKGVGEKAEKLLWDHNIHSWDDFLNADTHPVSPAKVTHISENLTLSKKAIQEKDHAYFSKQMVSKNHWRLFNEFKDSAAFIDIETTGLDKRYSKITTIVLYDGKNIKHFVSGINLFDFAPEANKYKLFISYNGKTFDIPFLEYFLNRKFTQSHIDLRYVLKGLGFQGGLKSCEKQFGLSRNELDGVDGYLAVWLWMEYKKRKNENALETLLAYNTEDVINLEFLMHKAYNLQLEKTPFSQTHILPIPPRPKVPFKADTELVKKIIQRIYQL